MLRFKVSFSLNSSQIYTFIPHCLIRYEFSYFYIWMKSVSKIFIFSIQKYNEIQANQNDCYYSFESHVFPSNESFFPNEELLYMNIETVITLTKYNIDIVVLVVLYMVSIFWMCSLDNSEPLLISHIVNSMVACLIPP